MVGSLSRGPQSQGRQGWWKRKTRSAKLFWVLASLVALVVIISAAASAGGDFPGSDTTDSLVSASSTTASSSTVSRPSSSASSSPSSTIPASSTSTAGPVAGELEVHYIDVGQGDSVLIHAPDGKVMLIDGGGPRFGNA